MSDQIEPASTESAKQDRSPKNADTGKRRSASVSLPSSRGPLLIAVAAGLVAGLIGGAAVAGLWHPRSAGSANFSDQEVVDAKKDVCGAVVLARQVVAHNIHLKNPDPESPVAQLAVAANARLSLTAAAAYLRGRLEADPAAPQDVVDATRQMAGALERLNLSYLVGQANAERQQLGNDLDSRIAELGKLCQ